MKITIPIFKSFYEINCKKEEAQNIEIISKQINKDITKLSKNTNINDEKTLLLLYCIELYNKINHNNNNISKKDIDYINSNINNLTQKINLITDKIIEQL